MITHIKFIYYFIFLPGRVNWDRARGALGSKENCLITFQIFIQPANYQMISFGSRKWFATKLLK